MVTWHTRLAINLFCHFKFPFFVTNSVFHRQVLTLFWNLAHSDEVPTEIMDQALNAHVKILDYSCSQERDAQKTVWIDKCIEELKDDKWTLPALKQIREICCLYESNPNMTAHGQRSHHVCYRCEEQLNMRVSYYFQ